MVEISIAINLMFSEFSTFYSRNVENGGNDWKEHGVYAEQVYGRQRKTRLGSEKIFEVVDQIIQENVKKGTIKE